MVMAIFLKWSSFRCNGGKVRRVLGRGECEGHVELPHVRVALQHPVYLCVCVFTCPPSPLLQSSNLRCGGGGPLSALSDFGGGGPLSPFCGLLSAFGGLLFFVGLGCLFWELNCDTLPNNLHQNAPHINTLPSGARGSPHAHFEAKNGFSTCFSS